MILVSGASGFVGGELVRRLAAKSIPVRALVRSPDRAGGLAGLPGVEIAVGDMQQPETLRDAFRDVDRAMVISSSVAAMADVQNSFIDSAARSGVKHMVKQRAAGVPPYAIEALGELFAERRKGKEAVLSPVVPDVFSWQPASFETFATRHAAVFRGEQPPPKV